MAVQKGDKITISGNSIFACMGLSYVSGEVLIVRTDGVSFKCSQTMAIETADFDDGVWTITKKLNF